MKTRHLLITIATIVGSIPSAAYRLETTGGASIAPERSIERQEDCVTVTYDFLGAVSVADELYPESVRLDIPGFGHNTKLGEPAYPVRISADGETEVCEYISYKIDFLPTEIGKQKSENKITHEVDETGLSKGVYVVELVENGVLIDSKKVFI